MVTYTGLKGFNELKLKSLPFGGHTTSLPPVGLSSRVRFWDVQDTVQKERKVVELNEGINIRFFFFCFLFRNYSVSRVY